MRKVKPQSILSTSGAPEGEISDLSVTDAGDLAYLPNESVLDPDTLLTINERLDTLEENVSNTLGAETFPLQNSLTVGDFYYKTTDTVYVKSSPALETTAKIRGLVTSIAGGTVTGALIGKTLTGAEYASLAAAGLTLNSYDTYYLGNTGRPAVSPDTTPGAFTKPAIVQGTLIEGLALQNGLEDEVQVVFTATGTLTILEYARATTVVVNSTSAVSITIAAITSAEDNKRVIFSNIGAGTLTVVNSVSGTANRTVATNASLRIFAYNSGWYLA